MPTDVIKTIGQTSSPITPDYSTLALWIADCPPNLVSDDKRYIGECLDQGTFTGALLISGITTDATRYIILRCATGASFKDKAGVRTSALAYNSSNGVTIQVNNSPFYAINCSVQYTRLEGLQIKRTGSYGDPAVFTCANMRLYQCIIDAPTSVALRNVSSNTGLVISNCLVTTAYTSTCLTGNPKLYACTIVNTAGSGTCIESQYSESVLLDCAVFGFTTLHTSALAAGTDYNATDLSSVGTGSNNVTSLTFAGQFENSASDWRAKSTGGLHAGTPNANAVADISGTTRDVTTPWIGCWEVAGGATSYTLTASAGSIAFTGQAATFSRTLKVTTVAGSLALTGQSSTFTRGLRLASESGSFTVTGLSAPLAVGRRLTAGLGTFTLTGAVATLTSTRRLSCAAGSFAVTGNAATFLRTYQLTCAAGSFLLTGKLVTVTAARTLTAGAAAYTLTGATTTLSQGKGMSAGVGTFTFTGQAAGLRATRLLVCAAGSFAFTGMTATTTHGYRFTVSPVSFAVTGSVASFARSYRLTASAGSFLLTGRATTLTVSGQVVVPRTVVYAPSREVIYAPQRETIYG